MRRKRWRVILAAEVALSILVAPFVVVVIGLELRGGLADPVLGRAAVLGYSFVFGIVQFGLAFAIAGLVCASVVMLVGGQSLIVELITSAVPPALLFPVAVVVAVVLSNRGHFPLIQNTVPYSEAAVPAGLAVGLLTLFIAHRVQVAKP